MPPNSTLPPAAFFILFALRDSDKHGYAIMQDARKLSDGSLQIGPATLYTSIQRLLDSAWIQEVDGPPGSDSRRRYYHLTSRGNAVFELELRRMENIVKKSRVVHRRTAESTS